MADDMSTEERRSLAEWAASDGATEASGADAAQAAQAAEAEQAKAAEIFAQGAKEQADAQAVADAEAARVAAEASDQAAVAEAAEAAAAEAAKDEATAQADDKAVAEPTKAAKKVAAPLPAWMKERLAEQTAKQREAERLATEARTRAEVAEAELAELRKRATTASGDDPAPQAKETKAAAKVAPNADFVPRTEVEARAAQLARDNALNASADQAYWAGKSAYPDWETALQPLNSMEAFNRPEFLKGVLATGSAHDVIYELGSDPDKASRILGYYKSGEPEKATAEMTRISDAVAARKTAEQTAAKAATKAADDQAKAAKAKKTAVSAVPAPIRPVGGSALPMIDLDKADDETFDKEFIGVMRRIGW